MKENYLLVTLLNLQSANHRIDIAHFFIIYILCNLLLKHFQYGLRTVGMGLGANGAPLTDIASVISTISTPVFQNQVQNGNSLPQQMGPFIGGGSFTPTNINQLQSAFSSSEQLIPSNATAPASMNLFQNTQRPFSPVQQGMSSSAQPTSQGYFNPLPSQPGQMQQPLQSNRSNQYGGGGASFAPKQNTQARLLFTPLL